MSALSFAIDVLQKPHEALEFCRLFESVYGHPMDLDTWRWKYNGAPSGLSLQLIARDLTTGEMIGHIGVVLLPGRLQKGSKPDVLWAQIGDIMVLESARGDMRLTGVYPRLVRRMQDELQTLVGHRQVFAYGFPGVRPFRLGQRLGYYREIQRCQITHYKPMAAPPWWQWRHWLPLRLRKISCDETLKPVDAIDQQQAQGPSLLKNAEYLEWRYRRHPGRKYTGWWTSNRKGQPTGWIFTSVSEDGRSLTIIDSQLPKGDRHLAIQALILANPDQRIQGWLSAMPGTTESTPIVATEFGTPDFHPAHPSPLFQPGDTDVF